MVFIKDFVKFSKPLNTDNAIIKADVVNVIVTNDIIPITWIKLMFLLMLKYRLDIKKEKFMT